MQKKVSINTLQARLGALQKVTQLERKLRRAVEGKIAQKKLQAPVAGSDTSAAFQMEHLVEAKPSMQAAAASVSADVDDATIVYASKPDVESISAPASTHPDAPTTLKNLREAAAQAGSAAAASICQR